MAGGGGGEVRDLVIQRDRADFAAVLDRGRPFGGVHDYGNLAVLHLIHDVWASFIDLLYDFSADAMFAEELGRAAGGDDIEPEADEARSEENDDIAEQEMGSDTGRTGANDTKSEGHMTPARSTQGVG